MFMMQSPPNAGYKIKSVSTQSCEGLVTGSDCSPSTSVAGSVDTL